MMTLSRSRMTKVSTDQRERLAMSVERLDQSSDKIRESRRTMMETEDLGVSVLQDLIITSKLLFVAGDLGQTFDSNITLPHYENSPKKGQAVLFVGDLSYTDNHPNHDNNKWDSWGRFSERSTAYQPWIWTTGNHELDFAPEIGENKPFKPFTHRYRTPYRASGSTEPFWYSIKRGPAYIIVLSSYSAYGKYTPQYTWLEEEFPKVNRTETPWLIVLNHSPWYNSYDYHYMEGETMRVMYEPWFVKNKVDVVFSGHVHAYERSERISNIAYTVVNGICSPVKDQSAPVYITIGDGGNIEGLATKMTEPQPKYSAYREASFGHAIFSIKNRTHAHYAWHRNHFTTGSGILLMIHLLLIPENLGI